MIYLYGLLEPGPALPEALEELAGVTGPTALAVLPEGVLIHGPHDGSEILPKRQRLLAHARVLETAAWFGTVLPMRFGMTAADPAEVADLLAGRRAEVAAAFGQIRGRVELGLRVGYPREAALQAVLAAAPDLAAEHGRLLAAPKGDPFARAEFGRRLAERLDARRAATQRALVRQLGRFWVAHRLRTPDSDVQVLSADVLLPEESQQAFAAALEAAVAGCGFAPGAEPEIRVVGPAPAFTFVSLSLGAPRSEAA